MSNLTQEVSHSSLVLCISHPPTIMPKLVEATQRVTLSWTFEAPSHSVRQSNKMLHLLTLGGIAVTGYWQGVCGQHFTAWAPFNEELIRSKSI